MTAALAAPASRRAASARLAGCEPAFWDRAARTLPGGTAFHDRDFLDLQEHLFGIVVERRALVVDGEPVGIVPVARRSRRSPRSPWIEFPFLGPAVPAEHAADALRAYRDHQRRTGLVLGHFDVAPSLTDAVEAAAAGGPMRTRRDGTVQIDLSHGSEERLDAAMSGSRRRLVRRAVAQGVTTRAARPGELAAVLGPGLAAAYARQGARSPYPDDVGAVIERWADVRDDVLLSVALQDGDVVAANVTLGGHPMAAGWVGARAAHARSGDAEALLIRFTLLRVLERGHSALELAGRVNDAVEHYKLSFGGRAVPYLTVESVLAPTRALDLVRRARARG